MVADPIMVAGTVVTSCGVSAYLSSCGRGWGARGRWRGRQRRLEPLTAVSNRRDFEAMKGDQRSPCLTRVEEEGGDADAAVFSREKWGERWWRRRWSLRWRSRWWGVRWRRGQCGVRMGRRAAVRAWRRALPLIRVSFFPLREWKKGPAICFFPYTRTTRTPVFTSYTPRMLCYVASFLFFVYTLFLIPAPPFCVCLEHPSITTCTPVFFISYASMLLISFLLAPPISYNFTPTMFTNPHHHVYWSHPLWLFYCIFGHVLYFTCHTFFYCTH